MGNSWEKVAKSDENLLKVGKIAKSGNKLLKGGKRGEKLGKVVKSSDKWQTQALACGGGVKTKTIISPKF